MEVVTDEELVERYRAAAGSSRGDAFVNQLFERHHSRVALWCVRMTGDPESAADLAQEVFIKAFQRLHSFRGESRFTTWLYAIARNHCRDELRSRTMRPDQMDEAVLDQVPDLRLESFSSTLERRSSAEQLRQLMRESLEDIETEIMTLHYVHEMPLDVITRTLGLTNPSGAKAHIVSARRKLSRAIELRRNRETRMKGNV